MTTKATVEAKFCIRWINVLFHPELQITEISSLRDGYILLKLTELFLAISPEDSDAVPLEQFVESIRQTDSQTQPSSLETTPRSLTTRSAMSSTTRSISKKATKEWERHNINIVFLNLSEMDVEVPGVTESDILAGKDKAIVDLLMSIALKAYVKDIRFQGGIGIEALLQWVRELSIGLLPGGMISFTGCWTDGLALSVLSVFPDKEVDENLISSLRRFSPIERNTYALKALSDKGVPSLLDPADVTMGLFTSRAMASYVGMIHSIWKELPLNILPAVKHSIEKEERERKHRARREEKAKKREASKKTPPTKGSRSNPLTTPTL
ncbi:hypothetical protein BLNAU_12653 [Blattamonas nauphoetae]|uniref:Calponin-homology (CH) domain-containing protein n=1 Tax=Blattamonas nauphoetae TaxID=2049346 RepID=A0ABQ9XQ82_9EUKA|nr:hypothetical protein BLNAU_12653 [Blattamonas nauphoetae]